MTDTNVKAWLNSWLQRKQIHPNYDIRPAPGRGKVRFKCELRASSFGYIGVGNAGSKKDSQAHAAFDFCQYLLREGHVNQSEFPFTNAGVVPEPSFTADNSPGFKGGPVSLPGGKQLPHTKLGATPQNQESGHFGGYGKFGAGASAKGQMLADYQNRQQMLDQRTADQTANAEGVDLTAKIHGGWTLENGRQQLNQFCVDNRIQAPQASFRAVGPDNMRSFLAEMTFYVPKLRRSLQARESASTKKSAERSASLSIVRQLYHLGAIPAYTGEAKKKQSETEFDPIGGDFNDDLAAELKSTVKELGIQVADFTKDGSLNVESMVKFEEQEPVPGGCIPWCPPMPSWNPWTGSNIEEGPYVSASMEEINADIEQQEQIRLSQIDPAIAETRNNLPIFNARQQLLDTINNNTVTIVKGATGSGKTTQLPQYILEQALEAKCGGECNVIVTQPRKISAVSIADRIAKERGEEQGQSCGYSVRFESVFPRSHGSIMLCTVGVLLRKLESGLRGVSHVVVDEIHERDLNTDFLLVVLRDIYAEFPNVRIILMSATIDTSAFSEYFGGAPVVEVSGRTFPVTQYFLEDIVQMLNYSPEVKIMNSKQRKRKKRNDEQNEENAEDQDALIQQDKTNCNELVSEDYAPETRQAVSQMSEALIDYGVIEQLLSYIKSLNVPGAILVFLPGWASISGLMRHLNNHHIFGGPGYRILPLHSQIPREDQYQVFVHPPEGVTKVILSTNIAETSITIDDVSFVIDSCKVKMKMFTSHNNMTNYATVWASQSNIEQRKGRAGRVREGFCFNLITKERHDRLDEQATPEILRTPLHSVALTIKLLRLGSIADFLSKALEVPSLDVVIEAEHTLKELNALDKNGEMTPLGRILARLPLEPRLGKMLILGAAFGIGDCMTTIAAASCFNEPFQIEGKRMPGKHRQYAGDRFSDHVALLCLFDDWNRIREGGPDREQSWCDAKQINMSTMRCTWEAKRQLMEILFNFGFPEESLVPKGITNSQEDERLDAAITLLALALAPNVAIHTDGRKVIVDGKQALLHKHSANCPFGNKGVVFPHQAFMFSEKVRTKCVTARQTTNVTAAQLVLSSKSVAVSDGIVTVDEWIPIAMKPENAAYLCSLKSEIDGIVITSVSNPENVISFGNEDKMLIDIITKVSSPLAIPSSSSLQDCHQSIRGMDRFESFGMGAPPPKQFARGGFQGGASGGSPGGGGRSWTPQRGSPGGSFGGARGGGNFSSPRPMGGGRGGILPANFGMERRGGGFGNRGRGFGGNRGSFGGNRGSFGGNRGGGFRGRGGFGGNRQGYF
ncbi:Oidioi.mRNA.OKI2018_I69.PAR.g10347.t1.cds [Oikopleura dioica]|uniref:RNA helicase n=1 Tax=Oikopleura dioica TaxID=34765 RepID=A0ABN7RVV6_OIKDI|nr:Oidioi.mRNA.OKI2018_I69.PAR.g10347.t1.cds [Oikopleura dioica]